MTALAAVSFTYTGDAAPTPPLIALTKYRVKTQRRPPQLNVSTTSGYWYGAAGAGSPAASYHGHAVPSPKVLITGTPIQTAGTAGTGATTLAVSASHYTIGTRTSHVTPVATYPRMTGNVTIPKGLSPGVHTFSVEEPTVNNGTAFVVKAPTNFLVPSATPCGSGGAYTSSGTTFSCTYKENGNVQCTLDSRHIHRHRRRGCRWHRASGRGRR